MNPEEQKLNLEQKVAEDRKVKEDKRSGELGYYQKKMEEFGAKPIERFVNYHPNPSRLMRRGITFAHKDLESIAKAMANNKPWAVVSGLNPSGPLHFGHKQVFEELLWLQEQGAEIFIPITNDESYVVGKTKSLAESRKIAYELVIPSIIALGFRSERTHLFVDSDYLDLYNIAMDISRHISLKKVMGIFGFGKDEEGENPGTLFYRGGVQLAQILLPQYAEFGGPKPTLIPVGIDQNPYIHLAREVAREKSMVPPSAIFTKFGLGLDGKGKMSSSRSDSAIFLTDDLKTAEKKLKTAYTGGSAIASFQREHGGIPEICPIGLLRAYHFEEDNSIQEKCSSGRILCGECKKDGIAQVLGYLETHQAKLPEARKRIDEYLLKTPLRSVLD